MTRPIRTHGESGLKTLFINPYRIDIVEGMDEAESDVLLDKLYEFAFQPRFQYRHEWRLGDIVVWDDPMTMHKACTEFDQTERRELHRLLLKGDVPV